MALKNFNWSNTKHTPGPWFTDTEYYEGKQFAVHGKNGGLISSISKQVKEPDDVGFSKKEVANAKLIASAPELLEIIQEYFNLMGKSETAQHLKATE